MDKALNLLGMMRRAHAIETGEDNSIDTVRAGKAKLVVCAADIAENALRKLENAVSGRSAMLIRLPYTKAELSDAMGVPGGAVAAITDLGFANALMKLLGELDAQGYGEAAQEIAARLEKADRRRRETRAQKEKKTNGKRRTNI